MCGTTTPCMTSRRMAFSADGVLMESSHAQHARQLCNSSASSHAQHASSHAQHAIHLVFIWTPYFSNSFAQRYGSFSPSPFFFIASSPFFLRRWPILHEDRVFGRKHCLDRPFEMDRLTVEILGFVVRGIVWRRWISRPGVGNWYARYFEASKTMGTQRRKIGRWQVPS